MMRLFLKKGREDSLRRFHPWVFSGAIARYEGNAEEGDVVEVLSHDGDFLAAGHYQNGSITVRILSFTPCAAEAAFWEDTLRKAQALRTAALHCADTTAYRLVHGEGDNLPGLIIDIYGNTAVLQAHSIGMFRARADIVAALQKIYGEQLSAVYDKSSATLASTANEAVADSYLYRAGTPENIALENGYRFAVDWEQGQKTGFFLDQRDNRQLLSHYAKGRSVLNLFCYTGGFSVYALGGGAANVCSVDSSQRAIELANRNAALNFSAAAPHEAIAADAFDFLRRSEPNAYNAIILDPPAFAKHKGALHNALQAYKRLNAAAFSRIASGGIIFTFSCSQVVGKTDFRNAVFSAAAMAGRNVRILHQLTQPADHPINIYHPEGEYLKGLVLYVE
ncbi:MAG: class I SAM-dependent rRNA methyltransferase [Prevotellaceae bacterium]|jgi:23S rRNA (cytosine1962-C5)-methyltransferase|nr:class I SAM-dependent rRNA methyltransferase [Prevotellaceae bacterium]